MAATAPLLYAELDAGWSCIVPCLDASEEGFGVVETEGTLEEIREEANEMVQITKAELSARVANADSVDRVTKRKNARQDRGTKRSSKELR